MYKYRFEKKIILNKNNYSLLYELLMHFKPIFPERKINNVYFDDLNYSFYFDHLNGACDREKHRVRWYPSFGSNPIEASQYFYEIKKKKNDLSLKRTNSIDQNDIHKITTNSIKLIDPSLYNEYFRKYYVNKENTLILTHDYKIKFAKCTRFEKAENFKNFNIISIAEEILEIKFEEKNKSDFIALCDKFKNVKISNFSKYINGMQLVYNF
jgi:SPX domain protein involved in polyphosphate accumulation